MTLDSSISMLTAQPLLWLGLIVLLVAGIAALVTYAVMQRRIRELSNHNTRLAVQLETQQAVAEQREQALAQSRETLSDHFAALSGDVLRRNSEAFLRLAQESLKQHHVRAEADLEKREQSIDAMVTPIREALQKTERQIQQIEKERREAYGGLTRHLESLAQTQTQLHSETRNLVQALRRPEVRGQWGELTLKRLVELAGMVAHCDFVEQPHVATDDGSIRPDMVVHLPDHRSIVVDAKTPLDAYLNAVSSSTDNERRKALAAHARNVRTRVRELSERKYWAQFDRSPEFVVLFIPGEQFLSAALDVDPKLQEDALAARIVVATPNNFVALMKTIAFGWRQQSVTENAERIRQLGEELHGRLATFFEHLLRTGKHLNTAVENFNRSVGSLERQVIPGARRFTELGIQSKKPMQPPVQLATAARQTQEPVATDDDGRREQDGDG